jgi:class 3 adenylate cyclase/tetratricopeptide (TPR) repeat protein
MTERTELEKAIAVLEAQRVILGDAVVDAAIAPMRRQLETQEQGQQPAGAEAEVQIPAERKLITILFADVVGSTALAEKLGAETTRLILDRCLRQISRAIDEFGGTVSSLMGDGLMAFFGVPQAYEDDPERAVLAASRIHQNVAGYVAELGQPLEVRVGINTGRVVLGEMGGAVHSEYTAMGPPVNLAARLQSAAKPGKTLLGESTARMVRYRFHLEPVEPLDLKGFVEPVMAYEPLGELARPEPARGIPSLQSTLVGRDIELGKLVEMTAGLDQGIGGIAALIGEPGIGKSRLLQETKLAQQNGQLRFAEGRAYSYTQDQPFSVVLDLLAELLDLAADDSPAILDLKLEATLGSLFEGDLRLVWPFLATLLGAPLPPQYADALSGLDPEALNARINQAVQLLVERMAAQRPLVLSFEDLHWADHGSLALIESLLLDTEHYPLLLIMLFRPDRDKPVWQLKLTAETHFAHRYLELLLAPLDEKASAEMIENLLEATNFPGRLRDMIGERAQGNPLYVEELIRSLIEGGFLRQEGDSWQIRGQITGLEVPETLEKVIQARLDRLPQAERATLQAASVIGRRFAYRVLEGIVPANGNLRSHLLRLQQVGMVRERSRLPEPEYIFKHVIVQNVTYSTLLREQRRQLHKQAAETLEKLFPDRREELAGTLAGHYAAAGDNNKAISLFIQAAGRAKEIYTYEEALHFLDRARVLSEKEDTQPEEQMMLLEQLADINFLISEAPKAIDFYQDALNLHQSLEDADIWTTVRLHRKFCEAVYWQSLEEELRYKARVQKSLEVASKLIEGRAPHLESVRLLAIAYFCVKDWPEPVAHLPTPHQFALAAVEMAEQLDAPVELSAARKALGDYHLRLGHYRQYLHIQLGRQQLSRNERFDDLREKLNILNETALALKMVGDYAQAIPLLLEAEELGEQIQDLYGHTQALWLQAESWVRMDRWDEVLFAFEKIQVLQQRYPLERLGPICWLLAFSASVYALRGDEEMSARLADESYAVMREFVRVDEETMWHSAHYY